MERRAFTQENSSTDATWSTTVEKAHATSSSKRFASRGTAVRPVESPSDRPTTTPFLMIPASRNRRTMLNRRMSVDLSGQASHQHVVVGPVKELLQVHVHDNAIPFGHILRRLQQRLVGAAPGPEAVARLRKGWVQQSGPALGGSACCTSRSTTAGMPSCRTPLPGFGISTPRTSWGR